MKKLVSLGVSAAILAAIYWAVDIGAMARAFASSDPGLLAGGIAMVVPITLVTAWRLCQLAPGTGSPPLGEALRLVLAASALNMILPSKMGDLAKSAFMRKDGAMSGAQALAVVIFEKACDMLALLAWCVYGLVLFAGAQAVFLALAAAIGSGLLFGILMLASTRFAALFFGLAARAAPSGFAAKVAAMQAAWTEMHAHFWGADRLGLKVMAVSVFLWGLHLTQIWMFALALGGGIEFLANLALAPLAILAGLLPLTFAGVGTRDAALIVLYQPYLAAPAAAALGLLCTLRYLMPAAAGVPFLSRYMAALKSLKSQPPS